MYYENRVLIIQDAVREVASQKGTIVDKVAKNFIYKYFSWIMSTPNSKEILQEMFVRSANSLGEVA